MALSNAELFSFGSFLVSLVAAAVAGRSLRNSTKALRLAESESEEKKMDIEPYLVQARKVVFENNEAFAALAMSYTNRASVPNCLSKVELLVTYVATAGEARQIFLQVETGIPQRLPEMNLLAVPINIPPRASTNGWLLFRLPDYLKGKVIKSYELAAYTALGGKVSITTYLLMDTLYGEDKDRKG